jgi:SAM-dependent methyltransferase
MAASCAVGHSPFDPAAERYDQVFTNSMIGRAQRQSVWAELDKAFHAGDHILEIGCGTGVDACYLAGRGVKVHACDSSPAMIAVAARKIGDCSRSELIRTQVLAAEEIANLRGSRLFDGALSNFGALNCVPDLRSVARNLAALVRPGANAILCWMGPSCLWEMLWYFARADCGKALRRRQPGGTAARLDGGGLVTVHYPSLRALTAIFAPEFSVKRVKGIGVAVPPSYVEPFVKEHPQWFHAAVFADTVLGRCAGLRLLADHILVRLERKAFLPGPGTSRRL